MNATIEKLVNDFAAQLVAAGRKELYDEITGKLHGLSAPKAGKVIKLPSMNVAAIVKASAKLRKKGPIQLCPAPGCKSPAAPIFGMLCAKHKGTSKTQVAKWRELRRAKAAKKAA